MRRGRPPIEFPRCRSCGEMDDRQFDAGYKNLCAACRRYNERLRYWHQRGRYLNQKPV